MVAVTTTLSISAVAGANRAGLVGTVLAGNSSAGEEKGDDTGDLHFCWSVVERWSERRLVIVVNVGVSVSG